MRAFFKYFFAALLALFVFTFLGFFLLIGAAGTLANKDTVETGQKAVLYIDLDESFPEKGNDDPFSALSQGNSYEKPGLYDLVRMIRYAAKDSSVKGIYIKANGNSNGFAASEEIRSALLAFKQSKKFIMAYGEVMSQKAYYVANVADKIYVQPKGGLEWTGLSIDYLFFKKALDKMEVEPRVFYAGKFKSATEPFRAEKMSDANRLQTQTFLNELYASILQSTTETRGIDSATLHRLANENAIKTPEDAVRYKLIDGAAYDDEVRDLWRKKLGLDKTASINFVDVTKYAQAVNYKENKGTERIALIYAQGDIVDGKGNIDQIGGDTYRALFRKARLDKSIKAIVVRVNSGGGSALASESMWRELSLAKQSKPVVISFGDYAASGGYYMSCMADSIFTHRNTITGSIGVFILVPNMAGLLNNKLGITVDGVKTGTYAGSPSLVKPMSAQEERFMQEGVDSVYQTFLKRVSDGRRMSIAEVDSIGQGRVWTGTRGLALKLADREGGLHEAIQCAARMAKLSSYRLREYPEQENVLERFFTTYKDVTETKMMKEKLGMEAYRIYQQYSSIQSIFGKNQTRMPFDIQIH
jgi:protease IV